MGVAVDPFSCLPADRVGYAFQARNIDEPQTLTEHRYVCPHQTLEDTFPVAGIPCLEDKVFEMLHGTAPGRFGLRPQPLRFQNYRKLGLRNIAPLDHDWGNGAGLNLFLGTQLNP